MDDDDVLLCRTFDEKGTPICDLPARYIVWGHLFDKRDKGPKCAQHLPEHQGPPWFLMADRAAIYEIPDVEAMRQAWDDERQDLVDEAIRQKRRAIEAEARVEVVQRRLLALDPLVTAHPNAEGHVAVFEDDEQAAEPCPYAFPVPSWAGADQIDPCPCDLPKGHDGVHECEHIRAKRARVATEGVQ